VGAKQSIRLGGRRSLPELVSLGGDLSIMALTLSTMRQYPPKSMYILLTLVAEVTEHLV